MSSRSVAGGGIITRFTAFFSTAFALLVQAIRRGTRLAMAMEGRGFGAPNRTWSRTSQFHVRDAGLLAVSIVMAGTAVGSALWAGTWNFIF